MAGRRIKVVSTVAPPNDETPDEDKMIGLPAEAPGAEQPEAAVDGDEQAEDTPDVVVFDSGAVARTRYRALRSIGYTSKAGVWCVIRPGRTFTTDELEFNPDLMERVDG